MPLRVVAAAVALGLLLAGAPAGAAPAARWAWPVPAPHPVVRGFAAPSAPWAAGHRGLDVAAAAGTPVTAPEDGTVTFAGRVVDRGVVAIDHGGGLVSSVEPVTPLVAVGERVVRGEVVGEVATGGAHAAGVLHLGARLRGEYVSPLLLLGGIERAVLLPLAAFPG